MSALDARLTQYVPQNPLTCPVIDGKVNAAAMMKFYRQVQKNNEDLAKVLTGYKTLVEAIVQSLGVIPTQVAQFKYLGLTQDADPDLGLPQNQVLVYIYVNGSTREIRYKFKDSSGTILSGSVGLT